MSITEGNITAIPVRILVEENDFIVSKKLITDAEKKKSTY